MGQGKVYGVSMRIALDNEGVDDRDVAEEEEDAGEDEREKEASDAADELGKQSLGRVKLSSEEFEGHEECPLRLTDPELEDG